tara:strand:+ start:319 stop:528 length:210 start_codon:yes stop_codon:yes gene_type:complete
MEDKDILDELKERIKEGPVIFTPDNDFLDRLNPTNDDLELSKDAIIDAAASHDQIINKLNDDENLDQSI